MPDSEVVLVTGTSRGIGNHLARHLVDRGYRVVGCSRSGDAGIDHERYVHRATDVSVEPDVVALLTWIRSEIGVLDAVVNNAATNPALSLVTLTSAAAATETLAANVLGPFLVCREAVKLMMRRGRGRIVNVGSMATRHEVAGEALYTASKAALNAFTRVLAKEVAAHGITCNVVAPAAVGAGLAEAVGAEALARVLERNAVREPGTLDEVADTVEWLLLPEARAITGQVIYLGGA